jgi:hypothetical protein
MTNEYISVDEFWDDWGVIQKSDGGMFEHYDVGRFKYEVHHG